jgi:beta-lactam-binding protein with PASTA domain
VAPGAAQGVVLIQLPVPGTSARRYTRVELVVLTDGPQPPPPAIETPVPDCVASGEGEAIETLRRAGLVPRIETIGGDASTTFVDAQDPAAGTSAGIGSFVTLRVARPAPTAPLPTEPADFPTKVAVPDLVGQSLSQAQATAATAALGLVLDPVMEPNPAVVPFRVYTQRIAAGTTVALGTLVRCRIAAAIPRSPRRCPRCSAREGRCAREAHGPGSP